MKPKIEELEDLKLVGIVTTGNAVEDINIPEVWKKFTTLEDQIKEAVKPAINHEVPIYDKKIKNAFSLLFRRCRC